MTFLVPVLVCVVCALCSYYLWKKSCPDSENEPPKLPGALPILGHLHQLVGDSSHLWRVLNGCANKSCDLGGVSAVLFGPRTAYVITDPDDAFTVANTCLEKDVHYDFAKPWLGEGLLTGKASIWKNHRKLLNPAFSHIVLDSFLGVLNDQARNLVKVLQKEVGRGPFDHWTYTKHNALETVCLTALGVDFTEDTITNSQYLTAMELMCNSILDRFKKFWLHSSYIFRWSEVKKKQDSYLKILHNISNTVLKRRKLEFDGNNILPDRKTGNTSGKKFKTYMDLLLELSMVEGVLNDREIREHVDTIIATGYETIAIALMYTLLLLGSHPEVQEKTYQEIREVFGDSDGEVGKDDLSRLVYLEAVLKESMRIYTIVPAVVRWLDKNVQLKNYTLAAGRTCFMFLFGIHRHPMWGPDADQFKPDRWLDPATLPDNPHAFTAFSLGRRTCIGKAYALMTMKIKLVHVLRHYRIKGDRTQLELVIDVILKPASGHYVSIEKRH